MHISVLSKEIVEGLEVPKGGIFLDGTLGSGGHSLKIAEAAGGEITIVGLDRDEKAVERARQTLGAVKGKMHFAVANYRDFERVLKNAGIEKIDAFLLDLGLSSDQLENSGRGFSFQKDEPLLMTFEDKPVPGELTAGYIVNNWEPKSLETIFLNYGEDKRAKRIALAIVNERALKPLETTAELRVIIERAVGRKGKIHPATKIFQALRIAVNDELGALRETLPKALNALKPGGKMAIISFHSLEDRIVKQFGKANTETLKIIFKKPIQATDEEIETNPRSRSAKLRIFQKK